MGFDELVGVHRPLSVEQDRFVLLSAFVAAADCLSFARAADTLNMLPSTVSRQVGRLEKSLGVRLLSRTTRSMALTEAGAIYHRECRALLQRLSEADAHIRSLASGKRGLLRLSAPVAFGTRCLAAVLVEFQVANPRLKIEATFEDRYVDVVREGYDLAVRIGDLPDSGLIARKIANNRQCLVATREYVERHGSPAEPSDLKSHNCLIHVRHSSPESVWRFQKGTQHEAVEIAGGLVSNNAELIYQAAVGGAGIGRFPAYVADEAIRAGVLIQLLPSWTIFPETNIYVVYPTKNFLPTKVKNFVECLSGRFRKENWSQSRTAAAANVMNSLTQADDRLSERVLD